ncbi:MAG: S49 family peptidase [Alphaproteobacteria bacterium]|nr:S49 family peptidase [Alphaproteobacteria bacterium]
MRDQFKAALAWLPFPPFGSRPPLVPVLRLQGVIAAGALPFRAGSLNLAGLAGPIERAFSIRGARAVALQVNSPGGSPVQSSLIAARIRQWAEEKKLPVIAFVEDVAASGGYWLATAADEILVDRSSILGSIGVISAGFGLAGLIEKLGIERRLHTQGERKSLLDPFLPERPEDVARLERLQRQIHRSFIDEVRARRGAKLVDPEANGLFTGEIFVGEEAVRVGLADGMGEIRATLRARFGEKVRLIPLGEPRGWLRRRLGLGPAAGGELAGEVIGALEERALWARFGL